METTMMYPPSNVSNSPFIVSGGMASSIKLTDGKDKYVEISAEDYRELLFIKDFMHLFIQHNQEANKIWVAMKAQRLFLGEESK
jgi:hypothetical protein